MSSVAAGLIALSAAILLVLGLLHLLYTFHGVKLHPRDADLQARMRAVSPVITRETTRWKTWIGFNASHSFGAILFGTVYGYLARVQRAFLFRSFSCSRSVRCGSGATCSSASGTSSACRTAAS